VSSLAPLCRPGVAYRTFARSAVVSRSEPRLLWCPSSSTKADFEAYLNGFSPNVQEILTNFEFRNQVPRLSKADALGTLIERFLDPRINLSPTTVKNGASPVPGLDNHAMGTIFEELVRRFNEENNEEAGERWLSRQRVRFKARRHLFGRCGPDSRNRDEEGATMRRCLA
jgi:type I restriction-modification system DNA methylase subunit